MSEITDQRRLLSAAVKPLLNEGETVTVAAGPTEYATGGLTKANLLVSVTVGEAASEAVQERLDELLSGPVKDAIEGCDLRPRVTRTSGYQAHPRPNLLPLLGAEWQAQILD